LVDRRVAAQLANTNRFGVQRELSTSSGVLRCLSFQKRSNGYEIQGKSSNFMQHPSQADYDGIKPSVTRRVSTHTLAHQQILPPMRRDDGVPVRRYKLPDRMRVRCHSVLRSSFYFRCANQFMVAYAVARMTVPPRQRFQMGQWTYVVGIDRGTAVIFNVVPTEFRCDVFAWHSSLVRQDVPACSRLHAQVSGRVKCCPASDIMLFSCWAMTHSSK
jgi:hypothetical protein